MDYDWIQFFIYALLHLLLAWVLVMPIWGAWIIIGFASFELFLGIVLLVLDVKRLKYIKKRGELNLDET